MVALLFTLICLIWGSTWLAIKVGLDGVPPFLGAGLRFVLAAALVGIVLAARRQRPVLTRDERTCVWSLGFLVFWINYGAVYWAEQRISSGLAATLFSTMPLMTALLTRYWSRSEALNASKVAGILIGVAGTALLFWPDERLGAQQVLGMLATLVACLCASFNLVTMKQYGRHADPLVLNFFGMGIGAACLLLTSAVLEPWSVAWTPSNVGALVYLAVFGSVLRDVSARAATSAASQPQFAATAGPNWNCRPSRPLGNRCGTKRRRCSGRAAGSSSPFATKSTSAENSSSVSTPSYTGMAVR